MTVRNLDRLFQPASIAVIGASKRPQSIGQVVARNLFSAGFDGPVMAVNPHADSIESTLAYPSIDDLPLVPDLAVVCTPPKTVPGIVDQLGKRGTRAAVIITAGFGEGGDEEGAALMQATLDAARPHLLRIVGPNCVGIVAPHARVNASFVHVAPKAGDIAFVSQSGAIATSIVDWATNRGIGFSHVVSLGDMADVDFGDMLDYLAGDPHTRAILLYVESISHARKFMSAGRAAARAKPVIVIKSGRSDAAAKAAASHTGALAGSDAVYDAAFRRAGMLRVDDLDELFDATETLASGLKIRGDRLAILTNGGGIGVLATDSLIAGGGRLAELAPETIDRLHEVLPPTWSKGNPVDIIGDAPGQRYAAALEALLADRNKDAVLVLNCPTAVSDPIDAARAVVGQLEGRRRQPVLTSWLGEGAAVAARRLFAEHRLPSYETPDHATRAFMHLVNYKHNQDLLMETPPSTAGEIDPDPDAARAVIAAALDAGRSVLTEPEAKAVLSAYGIPVVETVGVDDADQAAAAAERLGGRVALKILSPDISHKSDMGGVRLGLTGGAAVREAAERMHETIARAAPDARLTGFTVQQMADMPDAEELIVGVSEDRLFGPTILFGQGGTRVEVVGDTAIALPPLNPVLARDTMARTRVWNLLQGYRDRPAADLDAIALTLVRISRMVADLAEVAELDINPLLAGASGVLALDARVVVRPADAAPVPRLAIRPYPKALERPVALRDGREFLLRPIRPEDEPLLQDMIARSSADDIRLRFFTPMRQLTHQVAARLTQIDYDREMALVAVAPDDAPDAPADRRTIYGVVRIAADPDNERAEYGVMVRSDLKGHGLGYVLMGEILGYAKTRGIGTVYGEVLRENTGMLAMCEDLGFARRVNDDDPQVVEVSIDLATLDEAPPA
jgi:acetyltransferase